MGAFGALLAFAGLLAFVALLAIVAPLGFGMKVPYFVALLPPVFFAAVSLSAMI